MPAYIFRVIMKSFCRLGLFFITSSLGGSEASAKAANVSMMRFTQSICVTVSGDSVPVNAPITTMIQATRLTVSWNRIKRCMFGIMNAPT